MNSQNIPDSARYKLQKLHELADDKDVEISDVVQWFPDNINWLCNEILGNHGSQLNDIVSYKTTYDESDGKKFIVVMAHFNYEGDRDDPPDLKGLAPYITDIEITVDPSCKTGLYAEFTFETDKWKNLLPLLILDTAKFAFHSDSGIPSLRKIAAKDTLKFVQCLIPKMSQEVFDFAVENGMFENKELCLGWLAQAQLVVPSVVLPGDFDHKAQA